MISRILMLTLVATAAGLSLAVEDPIPCPVEGDPIPGCTCVAVQA